MAVETSIRIATTPAKFKLQPIQPDWILEGNPIARIELLSSSADGEAGTYYWDCTAGRFNWFYSFDETLCLLEGDVTLKFPTGRSQRVSAGDVIFFPAGASAEWTVDKYVRKLAFCRTPLPNVLVRAKRMARWIRRGGRSAEDSGSGLL
jgi:uncharacterized protein